MSYGSGQSYLLNPSEFGFRELDAPELREGKYVGIGASKAIRIIEGLQGQGGMNGALVIDGQFFVWNFMLLKLSGLM